MRRPSLTALLACVASALSGVAAAQQSTNLLVLDQDAGLVANDSAGTLFNLDLGTATDAAPGIEASAMTGAPFELISGVAISPIDGRAYIADVGVDLTAPFQPIGRIYAVDGSTGAIETIWSGAPLVMPFAVAFAPDGRLFITDPEADPSFLGSSPACGNYGAIFVIDTASCTAPCAPTLVADGSSHSFPPTVRSVFGEPVGIAYDPVRDRIYVADSCASELGWAGSVFSVVPATGATSLVASNDQFISLISVEVRPDGTPLLVDQGAVAGDTIVWSIDVGNTDPEANAAILTAGTQYSMIQDVAVDDADRVYLVDWGDYDSTTNTYIVPPAIWFVDETEPDVDLNGVLVNESDSWFTPVSGAVVPMPTASVVTPAIINGPTNVVIEGDNLFPGLAIDFGPNVAVSSVDFAPGYAIGTAIQAVLTPLNGGVVPVGCGGQVDLTLAHPFGGRSTLAAAATVQGAGTITPAPPYSTRGDANRDGIVDGLDLAILGRYFGREYCDGLAFWNDADFNDSDLIDGSDLSILTLYFGSRP